MRIYEIDKAIEELIANAVDPETGELILDNDALDQLQMERDQKIENLALYVKELTATAKAMRDEEKNLAERRQTVERKAERLKQYLIYCIDGQKFTTARVACSFRRSEAVEIGPEFVNWAMDNAADLLRLKPEADKQKIRELLKNGLTVPYTGIIEKSSVTIK